MKGTQTVLTFSVESWTEHLQGVGTSRSWHSGKRNEKVFRPDEVEEVAKRPQNAEPRREIAAQMSSNSNGNSNGNHNRNCNGNGNGKCTKLNLMNIKIMQQQESPTPRV